MVCQLLTRDTELNVVVLPELNPQHQRKRRRYDQNALMWLWFLINGASNKLFLFQDCLFLFRSNIFIHSGLGQDVPQV